MALFSKKKKPVVGVDIGHSSVKGVELQPGGGGLVVRACGEVPITVSPDDEKYSESVVQAIRDLFANNSFSTKRAVIGLSGEAVIVRVIRMPYFGPKEQQEMEFAVYSEAQDFIPFDMADVAFDYQRIAELDGQEGKALEVLIVASPKDLVAKQVDIAAAAGLDVRVVDVASFALVNAMHFGGDLAPPTPLAIVNVGAEVTNIAIMKGDTARFTRDLSTAGTAITRAIMRELDISFEEAEQVKKDYGIRSVEEDQASSAMDIGQSNLPDFFEEPVLTGDSEVVSPESQVERKVHRICEQYLGEIVSEIKRCLLFYENQLDGQPVEKVLLTGGTVLMKNAPEYIRDTLDTAVEIVDPFLNVTGLPGDAASDQRAKVCFTTSLGLAVRGIRGEGVK